jgi:hypothetical protein
MPPRPPDASAHGMNSAGSASPGRWRLAALLVLVLGTMASTAGAAAPQDSVVGSGKLTFADVPEPGLSTTEQQIVNAHSGPSGEDSSGMLTFHSPLLESNQAQAEVQCLVVSGDTAIVGGRFPEPVLYGGLAWRHLVFVIRDNGPRSAGPDQATGFIFIDRERPPGFLPCNSVPPPASFPVEALFPVEQGDYTVTDVSP